MQISSNKIGTRIPTEFLIDLMKDPGFLFSQGNLMYFAGIKVSGECKGCGFTLDRHLGCPKCRRLY